LRAPERASITIGQKFDDTKVDEDDGEDDEDEMRTWFAVECQRTTKGGDIIVQRLASGRIVSDEDSVDRVSLFGNLTLQPYLS
jgi:hypothetical protein